MDERYPFLGMYLPANDDPLPRPEEQQDKGKGRWGHAYRDQAKQTDAVTGGNWYLDGVGI